MPEKVALCRADRQAAGKCRKEKLELRDQTISPKARCAWYFDLSLACVADPKQLNHGVGEGKTATGRTLTGMLIWRSLMQAELNKFFSRGSAWSGTDEQMVQLYPHAR